MTTLREAAQMALDALELHGQQYPHMVKGYCLDAIEALRAALAAEALAPARFFTCPTCNADRSKEDCKGDRLRCGIVVTACTTEWQRLTSAEVVERANKEVFSEAFARGAAWAEQKLVEKNHE